MSQQDGLFLIGTIAGVKQRDGVNQQTQKPWTMHFVGLEIPVPNGYPGETKVTDVQLSRDHVDSGLIGRLQTLVGKQAALCVYVRAYANRSGAGFSYNLSNEPNAVTETSKQVKAA